MDIENRIIGNQGVEREMAFMKRLTDEIMWQAVVANDQSFDGFFYYGVSTTGIFCRPSCKSKVPNRENVRFFMNADRAFAGGYRACKRCRPEFTGMDTSPMDGIITRVIDILRTEYSEPEILNNLPERVGISDSHLQHTLKKYTGFPPKRFLQNIRIDKAKELLISGESDNITICFAVGYQSLSCFYAAFRMVTGTSPRKYRLYFRGCAGGTNHGIVI
jgi:AraC family transcriptional regulator of adaptative response / methylphosphotriester-DNA alkyltransferase methyltransferase